MPISEPPQAGAPALLAARRSAGLTQEQLAEASGVSVRTVRGLESGRVTSPHRRSLEQLAAALGLSPDAVGAFVARWRSARAEMSFTELVAAGGDIEQILADAAARAASDQLDVSVVETLTIGPDRRSIWNENLVAMQALRDGVDHRLVLWGRDPEQDVSRVRIDDLRNCTEAARQLLPDHQLVAFELSLGRPLRAGETHVYGYRLNLTDVFAPGSGHMTTDALHGFRRGIHSYVLQVEFSGCAPPARAWQTAGAERRRVRRVDGDARGNLHLVAQSLAAGVHGIEWEWD